MSVLVASRALLRSGIAGGLFDELRVDGGRALEHEGRLYVAPARGWPERTRSELAKAGFEFVDELPAGASSDFAHLAELVALEREREPSPRLVLFVAHGQPGWLELAADLVRLGARSVDVCAWRDEAGDHVATKATFPPWYAVERAIEREDVDVFAPARGTPRCFVAIAWRHPLAATFRAPEQRLLLVGEPDASGHARFTQIPDGPWRSLDASVDVAAHPRAEFETRAPTRIEVELCLVAGPSARAPTLWLLGEDAEPRMEELARRCSDEERERLAFALRAGTRREVLLRDVGAKRLGVLPVEAQAYVQVEGVPGLFVPQGRRINPPLSPTRLREVLAVERDFLTLCREHQGALHIERVDAEAFEPLERWVDYVVSQDAEGFEAWRHAGIFEWEDALAPDPAVPASGRSQIEPSHTAPEPSSESVAVEGTGALAPHPEPELAPRALEIVASEGEVETLLGLAHALRSSTISPVQRRQTWCELARGLRSRGRKSDADMAWAHALWDLNPDDTEFSEIAKEWGALDPESLRSTLEREAHRLDSRTRWLGARALSARQGGDALGLARASDEIERSLAEGLAVRRELPQVVWQDEASSAHQLGEATAQVFASLRRRKRHKNPVEGDPERTACLVDAVEAWTHARLGRGDLSEAAWTRALERRRAKVGESPLLELALDAYAQRIDEARRGLLAPRPLASRFAQARLELAERSETPGEAPPRYAFDRLLETSTLLFPDESFDAAAAFVAARETGVDRAPLSELDAARRRTRLQTIVEELDDASDDTLAERLRELVDSCGIAPSALARKALSVATPAAERLEPDARARWLEAAAGHVFALDERALMDVFFARLSACAVELLHSAPARSAALLMRCAPPAGAEGAQIGLREALDACARAARSTQGAPRALAAFVLAPLRAEFDSTVDVRAALEALVPYLADEGPIAPRLRLVRDTARALARCEPALAVTGMKALAEFWPQMSDSYSTARHFSSAALHFSESLALAAADVPLRLGPEMRGFVARDEHELRQRIRRDLAALD